MTSNVITPTSELPNIPIKKEIDINEFRKVLTMFKEYYDGLTRGNMSALSKLLRFYGQLEDIVFGEKITVSWNFTI